MAKKAEFNIETVKKYIFWVLVPIALLTTIFVGTSTVGRLTNEFNSRKTALEGTKKNVEAIRSDKAHPNQQTIDDIDNKTKETNGRVVAAWRILEKDQKERNLWPIEVGPLFMNEVVKLKWGSEISVDSREAYLNFINRYLPELEKFVERRRIQRKGKGKDEWLEMDERDSAFANLPTMSDGFLAADALLPRDADGNPLCRIIGVVDWPNPETRNVTHSWLKLPKATEIWYAQEELWVYKALLWVVRETNAGATGPHNAVVKRIENLLIGKSASGIVAGRSALRLGAGTMSGAGMDSGGGGSADGPGGAGLAFKTEKETADFLRNMRYVDSKFQPLAATAAAPYAEFNRMPVCLRLIVDQRRIPEILVNCANCAMPIEVLWVRFNPGETKPMEFTSYGGGGVGSEGAGAEGASGGGGGGGGGESGGMGTVSESGGGGAARTEIGGDASIKLGGELSPYGTESVAIEIYGCISIFNSVDEKIPEQPAAAAQ